jgi:hypothetical protein
MKFKIYFSVFMILSSLTGCVTTGEISSAPSKLYGRILECTGGIRLTDSAKVALNAAINEANKSGDINLEAKVAKMVEGAILMDEKADSPTKQLYITEYQKCMDKTRN